MHGCTTGHTSNNEQNQRWPKANCRNGEKRNIKINISINGERVPIALFCKLIFACHNFLFVLTNCLRWWKMANGQICRTQMFNQKNVRFVYFVIQNSMKFKIALNSMYTLRAEDVYYFVFSIFIQFHAIMCLTSR